MRRATRWLFLLTAFALIAAACGDEAETTTTPAAAATTVAPATTAPPAPTTTEEMMAPPEVTLGYLQVLGASEAAQRLEIDAKEAVDLLGWDWVYCDAQGVLEQMQTCADTLIDQGVDAIMTDGTTVEVIVEQLERAQEAGIPFINTGGTQSFYDLYAGSYNPNDAELGRVLAEWIVENAEPGAIFVSGISFAAWGAQREASLAEAIEGTDFFIEDAVDIDFADVPGSAADAVSAQLTANPDTKVVWLTFDLAALGVGPVITDAYPEGGGPVVGANYANCGTLDQMKTGGVTVAVEESLEWSSWVGIDQIAAFFAFGTPFSQDLRPVYQDADGNDIQFSQPFIVLPEDAPDECIFGEGPYVIPPDPAAAGYREFFRAKWAEEYGV